MARPEFHPLPVLAITPLTDDAVAIDLGVPDELRTAYSFTAGQHLTLRIPGDDLRRSYSLCVPPGGDVLRIGVRRLPGGAFSEKVLADLSPGDRIDVMTPMGRFGSALSGMRRPAFVAAGSGITPVLSMVATALADPEVEAVTLVCINRTQRDVMFLDDIADLKDRHPTRLHVVQVLTREQQESELLTGRPDAETVRRMRGELLGPADGWFLCGPFDLVTVVHDALVVDGVDPGSIHSELFHAESLPALDRDGLADLPGATVVATLDGRTTAFNLEPGELLLDGLLRVRSDAPYACKGGVCGTCRARLREGDVEMAASWALEPEELDRGYVLTCQSRATSARLELDYDG